MEEDSEYVNLSEYHSIDNKFRVLDVHSCLPRFAYHKWLVHWCLEGLEMIKGFTVNTMKECMVVVGGDLSEESRSLLYSKQAEEKCFLDFAKGMVAEAEFILLYFLTESDMDKLENLLSIFNSISEDLQYKEAELYLVMQMDTKQDSVKDISTMIQKTKQFRIPRVFPITKHSITVKHHLTISLEMKLNNYLCDIERQLSTLPSMEGVEESLEKVRAVLERLRKAHYFPKKHMVERPYNKEQIMKIIERYEEKILYHGFNKKGVRIVTNDKKVKEDLLRNFSDVGNFVVDIIVQSDFEMTPFADHGIPLHGAKYVYRQQSSDSFFFDNDYATTGSLVKINDSRMAALTCQHAFLNRGNQNVFVNINNSVVKLGRNMFNLREMRCIHDDIALIDIDKETIRIIDSHCEKLLLDVHNEPAPADLSRRDLDDLVEDIVHKRGACTDLTTGIIIETGEIRHRDFPERASAIIVKPNLRRRGHVRLFGAPGDSGALLFQPSLSLENKLEVIGMLYGRAPRDIFPHPDTVICIPLGTAVEKLKRKIQGLREIDFYKQ
ncbi:uncharacterized protein LOC134274055 [Saccostrea cucullata]|uniref:uncharacterized protein LOC134274055 n=1 Tax=Saccostrea cuccullata TaxID=36930 RepID=UPI002ED4F24C